MERRRKMRREKRRERKRGEKREEGRRKMIIGRREGQGKERNVKVCAVAIANRETLTAYLLPFASFLALLPLALQETKESTR